MSTAKTEKNRYSKLKPKAEKNQTNARYKNLTRKT